MGYKLVAINIWAHEPEGIGPVSEDTVLFVRQSSGPASFVHIVHWPAGTVFRLEPNQEIVYVGCPYPDCLDCKRKREKYGAERLH